VRRGILVLGLVCLAGLASGLGCGIDAVGILEPDAAQPGTEGGANDAALPGLDSSATDGGGTTDAPADGTTLVDAQADAADGAVAFAPSHIQAVYSLTAPNVTIATSSELDTTARTIAIGAAAPVPLANLIQSDTLAVWSVGSFVLAPNVILTVKGTRPLVIVAASTVELRGHIAAYGDAAQPGPGGLAAASGPGKGGNGNKTSAMDISGGGGAGHATAGGAGGKKNAGVAGAAGLVANANGAMLVGGSGGGHGGGFTAATCSDPTRGRGGVGGGAIQISARGKLLVASTGSVDVGGGGGSGGCKDNGANDDFRGGGGGGAGGLVFLESVASIEVEAGAELAAAGGGGGEGGDGMKMGADGQAGPYPSAVATGGGANSGGTGGNGGTGAGSTTTAPTSGQTGSTAGGGGGSTGRVFFGTRSPALLLVNGKVSALRSDFAF
jgi:hypothetical protein